ncbi:acylamino-acid-releasing enzyme-like [Neodiprion fabricii]|uniref:acylamino-acid-releasing enzyme-like n=1 Tax=Neodiprion fabricii TaxID=2872261 RepID=UPI001ED910F6|nr:acylamino-acid-releasing enzyme-like [Neodiprion fabricii]
MNCGSKNCGLLVSLITRINFLQQRLCLTISCDRYRYKLRLFPKTRRNHNYCGYHSEGTKMTSTQIDRILNLYKSVVINPALSDARILDVNANGVVVQSAWTQRNLDRRATQRFTQQHLLDSSLNKISETFPIDVTTEITSSTTEDEQRRAVLRQATVDNASKQFIEIWDRQHLVKNYDLAALDVHGDIYTDSEFGAFNWSPDKTKLIYIAEKKLPKSEPFYKQASLNPTSKAKSNDEETTRGNEYLYKPHWGERLVGKHRPVVVILDTEADTITALSGIPDYLSPGQPQWTPDGQGVVGVAWKHEPRYLGLTACTNRESWIFHLKDGEYTELSANNCAVRSPRFSPNGKYLIWLERQAGGPHHNAQRLMRKEWTNTVTTPEILVNVINVSITITDEKQFYGLYNQSLPLRCWSNDSQYLFLSTAQRANTKSYIINIESKNIIEIVNDTSSLSILDVKNDIVAFVRTSLVEPTRLAVGRFNPAATQLGNIERVEITVPLQIEGLENLKYEFIEHMYDNNDEVKQFNSIYFGPKTGDAASTPLIVTPHGGPHSSYANSFSVENTVLALLGFGILQVNFRGSTGMGSKNVEFLQGKVGTADTLDCVSATREALEKYPWLDASRMGLSGGSHGGFLVAHLSGQYPNLYRSVVARNPVIDIAAMFTISDIPDWCPAVTGFSYHESVPQPLGTEMFVKMFESSPIIHADKVRAPTLMLIGTNDLRVPSSQGKLWYQRLKAINVVTKMLVYEDNHQLSSGPIEIDNIINTVLWHLEHVTATTS